MFKVGDIVRLNRTLDESIRSRVERSDGCLFKIIEPEPHWDKNPNVRFIASLATGETYAAYTEQLEPFGEE